MSILNRAVTPKSLGLPSAALAGAAYVSGRYYSPGPPGAAFTSTNTSTLTSDTMYGTIGYINSRVTIPSLTFRTSTTNASVGAALKFAIYALDANLLPTSRLAVTTTGVAVGDLATATSITGTFDTPVTLDPGVYLFVVLPTTATTAVRAAVWNGSVFWASSNGATSPGNLMSGAAILMGYTGSATYSSGPPSTFGTPTAVNSGTNLPILSFLVA